MSPPSAHAKFFPALNWRQQRLLMLLVALAMVVVAVAWLVASGLQLYFQARAARSVLKQRLNNHEETLVSAKAVVEAKSEILRGMLDSALLHAVPEKDASDKVLAALFSEIMEKVWDYAKSGMLEEEVMVVLETALESKEECATTEMRRELTLDFLASVLQQADGPGRQGKLLSGLATAIQQQMRVLVKDGLVARKVLLDIAAAKETDSLLDQRLQFLLNQEACCAGTGGSGGCWGGICR